MAVRRLSCRSGVLSSSTFPSKASIAGSDIEHAHPLVLQALGLARRQHQLAAPLVQPGGRFVRGSDHRGSLQGGELLDQPVGLFRPLDAHVQRVARDVLGFNHRLLLLRPAVLVDQAVEDGRPVDDGPAIEKTKQVRVTVIEGETGPMVRGLVAGSTTRRHEAPHGRIGRLRAHRQPRVREAQCPRVRPRGGPHERHGELLEHAQTGLRGTSHRMSMEHLPRYVTEFEGRHNGRDLDTAQSR